ncbi:PREDICTED: zinc finger protein 501, partial [Nicrophorus vespilloides]|uniref:Zinc finger protein 501 n=1 Tax=Nicrophorus vespilloides TaxID=110193 RepID=A0ABM1M2M1_NICVS
IAKFWNENEDNPDNQVDTKLKNTRPDPEIQYFIVKEGIAERVEKDAANTDDDVVQVFQCPVCSVHFIKERQYQLHKCTKMKFQCTECDASFPHSRSLSAHMRMHRDRKTKTELQNLPDANGPFICEHCNTQFGTYKSLRLHIRMHDPVKSKEIEPPVNYGIMGEDIEAKTNTRTMFTCKICNKVYDEGYKDIHLLSHSTKNNYDCTICNRKFFTESNLEMHLRVHNTEKTQTCTYCKKEFDDAALLQQHVKQHIESRPYECSYCNRRFIRPHEKVKHERIHTGEKPHICELCGKAFRVSYCLTLHMRTHSGSRPYQCQECGKRFKAHSVYNHHLLIHSNVRKYKCPYCPKAFKTAVQLAGHRNTHTKPFTCTECNRPFASLYAVRSHMETHKQDNNLKYNCYACGASYARAFALRDHIKSHHEDQWDKDYDPMLESSSAATSILQDEDGNEIENVFIVDSNTIVDIPQQDVIIEQN